MNNPQEKKRLRTHLLRLLNRIVDIDHDYDVEESDKILSETRSFLEKNHLKMTDPVKLGMLEFQIAAKDENDLVYYYWAKDEDQAWRKFTNENFKKLKPNRDHWTIKNVTRHIP